MRRVQSRSVLCTRLLRRKSKARDYSHATTAPVEQVDEQVDEQGKKKKITKADLNKQAKAKREAKQVKAETATA